jgi:hypothetical protein
VSAKDIKAGRAFVEVTVRDKLQQGIRRAMAKLRGFAAGVKVVGTAIGGIGAAFASVGAGMLAPIAAAAKLFADAGSQLHDLSVQTGLSVEQLSELKFAAEQSGASLDDVAVAIKNMQRQGISASRLDEIAAGIAAIEDPTKPTEAALKIFGKSGAKLLPMLMELGALRAQARASGLIISTEDAARADALGDSMDRLKSVFKAVQMRIGAEFAGAFTMAFDVASGALIGIAKMMGHISTGIQIATDAVAGFSPVATAAFGGVLDALKGGDLIKAWEIIVTTMQIAWISMSTAIQTTFINMLKAVLTQTQGIVNQIAATISTIEGGIAVAMGTEKTNMGGLIRSLGNGLGTAAGGLSVASSGIESNAASELAKALEELAKLRIEAAGIAEQTKKGNVAAVDAIPLNQPTKNVAATGTFSAAGAGMLGRAGTPLEREAKKTNALLEKNNGALGEIKDAIEDGGLAVT